MSDDRFFERIRAEAQPLQYVPGDEALTRLSARIRARVAAPPTVAQLLANWFRPLAVSVAALALAAAIGVQWYGQPQEQTPIDQISEQISARTMSVDGDFYGVSE
jgi:hypothetical protein